MGHEYTLKQIRERSSNINCLCKVSGWVHKVMHSSLNLFSSHVVGRLRQEGLYPNKVSLVFGRQDKPAEHMNIFNSECYSL